MRRVVFFGFVLAGSMLLVSCGTNMSPSSPVSGARVTLAIADTAPKDTAVLFLEALITGASLQPMDTTKPAVSLLSTPTEVEFGHLQTVTAFLSMANVPPDTYASLNLTFGNAMLTFVNHSSAAIAGCAVGNVCEIMPTVSPMTVTISSAPLPVTVDENSVVGIRLDLNVDTSVQPDLSINPAVTITRLTQREDSDEGEEMEEFDEIDGQVTAVTGNQITLMNERSGQSFTIMTDSTTVFEDFGRSGCTTSPADISCVQVGQILNVDLSENGMGTMLAKRVEFEEAANKRAIKGTITSVDSMTQFEMVVYNEEPAVGGVSEGSPVTVTINPNATFRIGSEEIGEDGGFSISGLTFASSSDLLVGQNVQIRPGTPSTSGGVTTITTDLVSLWPSQITGTVGSPSPTNGTFSLTNLSALFTGATPSVTTINVVTLADMNFEDFSGFASLMTGSTVSVKGLLFNTPTTPTIVTRTLREENGGQGNE